MCNKNVYSAIDELKESALDENIYEELKKNKTDDGGAIPGNIISYIWEIIRF